jgi:hypothetical protein
MSVAKWAKTLPGDKYETVAYLPPKALYLLAAKSTPEDIENEVIADIGSGKPVDSRQVKTRIEEAKEATATTGADAPLDEQGEVAQGDPELARDKKHRRTREEIERDAFLENRLSLLGVVAGVDTHEFPVPKLNAEDAKQAIKQIKKAEACLRQLRREIEKQHAEPAPAVDPADPDHEVRR